MKYCIKCGAQLDDSANFCNNCGAAQNEDPATAGTFKSKNFENDRTAQSAYSGNSYGQQNGTAPNFGEQRPLSLSDYVERYEPSNVKTILKIFAVMCFVLAGISVFTMFLLGIAAIIDVLVYAGLGYGILKKKSAGCGLAFTVYYALGSLLVMNSLPAATNFLRVALLAFFILGTVYLFSAKSHYKKYLMDNFQMMS